MPTHPATAIEQLQTAIAALESQRTTLGDAVVETALAPLREKLATLQKENPDEQRKVITVLFSDVSGYTALSEKMDAEDITNLMNDLWLNLDATIISYGGEIDKHMGDGVMALWGINASREDEPERAIRAALAMQQFIQQWGQEKSLPFSMRIGIHTGAAILGQIGTGGEFTAMGDTVNLASRLEQAAPVGGILISHSVYRQVRGLFELTTREPLTVKGKSEPIQTYLVNRARPRTFRAGTRGVEGVETRMIGREEELRHLQESIEVAQSQKRAHMVTVTGEAGLGKSRLLHEFLLWVDTHTQADLFKARADEEMQRTPYGLLRDLLATRFEIHESDSLAQVRAKMALGLGESGWGESAPKSGAIAQLIGYETAEGAAGGEQARASRNKALRALESYLRQIAQTRPILLVLDDLHWCDDSSLDVITHLANALADLPVVFLCASRPTLYERRATWGESLPHHSHVELHPLSGAQSQQLVAEILQKASEIPADLRELVVQNAEGNPFYVEELIKMLLDDGVIEKDAQDNWHVRAERLNSLRVPATLNGILQARFDNLPGEEQRVLQRAAVVGRVFWDNALHFLATQEKAPAQVEQALGMLRRREMIFPRSDSTFAEAREYIFKHALMRDAVYERILKRVRRNYHALVAEWLIQNNAHGAGDLSGLIADHLEQAGQTAPAIQYLMRAGKQAAAQFANAEALQYFSRALALTPPGERQTILEILLARENIYDLLGERDKQQKDLLALEAATRDTIIPSLLADICLRRARYCQHTSDYPGALSAAGRAIVLAQQSRSTELESAARAERGRALYRQAFYAEARTELEKALQLGYANPGLQADILQTLAIVTLYQSDMLASQDYLESTRAILRRTGNRQVEANLLTSLGTAATENIANANTYFEEALAIYREIGDRRGEANALQQLGLFHNGKKHFELAEQCYRDALRLYQSVNDRLGEGWMYNAIGALFQYQGRIHQAWQHFETALNLYRTINVPWGEAISLHNLGVSALLCGQYATAREHLQFALHLCRRANDRWGEIWRLSYLGYLEYRCNNLPAALEYANTAVEYAQNVPGLQEKAMTLTHQAHIFTRLGRYDEARTNYLTALEHRAGLGERHVALETLAGLINVLHLQDNLPAARAYLQEALTALETPHTLQGADDPWAVYLTIGRALQSMQDARAEQVWRAARAQLQARRVHLSGDFAQSFEKIDSVQELLRIR
jgi:predicted ATPase/class 3 adenylate cyclase